MIVLAQQEPAPVLMPVPVLEGVTTALVAFIFACVIFPHLVKNKTQFYGAFAAVIAIIALHSLNTMVNSFGFQVFAGALTGILQVCAFVLLFLAAGGITLKELGSEMGRAYEVIRRGENEKTVIVPLSGEMPKPRGSGAVGATRNVDDEIEEQRIDLPSDAGWPAKPQAEARGPEMPPPRRPPPDPSSSIPLE